jgi:hypothetical protein
MISIFRTLHWAHHSPMNTMKRVILFAAAMAGCNHRSIDSSAQNAPLEAPCHFDKPRDARRAVFAAATGDGVMVVRADGSRSQSLKFAGPATSINGRQLAVRGNFLAASAEWSNSTTHWHEESQLRTLDDNRLLFQQTWTDTALVTMQLGPDGLLALGRGDGGTTVWDPNHGERNVDGFWPIAAAAGGHVAVRSTLSSDGSPTIMGWLRAGSSQVEPVAYAELVPNSTVYTIDDRLVYLGQRNGVPFVVSELPGDARVVALPPPADAQLTLSHTARNGWLLVGTWQNPLYRVNVRTAEVTVLGIHTPEGLARFQGGFEGPTLADDGALLLGLRDPIAGGLYRSPDGAAWTRVGGTVANVLDIIGYSHAGTYLITGTSSRYASETWSDPTPTEKPDINGDSVQVARAGATRHVADADTWDEAQESLLSSDGLCLAYWSHDTTGTEYSLKSLDVESGEVFDLLGAHVARSFDAAAWVESN